MTENWNLGVLYSGFDDEKLKSDILKLESAIAEYKTVSENESNLTTKELLTSFVKVKEEIDLTFGKLYNFSSLSYSADTKSQEAQTLTGRLLGIISESSSSDALIQSAIAKREDLMEVVEGTDCLREFSYLFARMKRDSKYLLSAPEESLFSKLNISGANAWEELHSTLTSSLTVKIGEEEIPLSSARNLAHDEDPEVRREAYLGEIKAYDKIKDSAAFALNSIKHQVITECALRGFESPLDKALLSSSMKKETLEALIGAMKEYLPVFRKYLKAKAKYLGHNGALPWYDLFAPIGEGGRTFTTEEARDYLLSVFGEFDSDLYDLVKEAFDNSWIDFYPREGKVGGAFDCGLPNVNESRVLTNFSGSFSDVTTLAHELGHSFHDRQVYPHSILNRSYSMPVAETASTFNEVMVMKNAVKCARDKKEKLTLLEGELMDTTQIITDILSRFIFESEVFERRKNEFLDSDTLCDIMIRAQKETYGDAIDEKFMHPYMWVCKGHYYSGSLSFYNYPYAFGGLFARGLYAKYEKEGRSFAALYKKLLWATGISDAEDTALMAGIDLTRAEFWRSGLEGIKSEIDEFCALVDELKG